MCFWSSTFPGSFAGICSKCWCWTQLFSLLSNLQLSAFETSIDFLPVLSCDKALPKCRVPELPSFRANGHTYKVPEDLFQWPLVVFASSLASFFFVQTHQSTRTLTEEPRICLDWICQAYLSARILLERNKPGKLKWRCAHVWIINLKW